MRLLQKQDDKPLAPSSRLFIVTFSAVLLFLSACGVLYWQYVSSQTLYLKERNFRALATTSQALAQLIANYEKVFKSIVEGDPTLENQVPSDDQLLCLKDPPTPLQPSIPLTPPQKKKRAFAAALCAIHDLRNVTLTANPKNYLIDPKNNVIEGLLVKFERDGTASRIKLDYTHKDIKTNKLDWNIEAELDITHVLQQLMVEEIFSDLLLANDQGNVFYHQRSQRDASGLEFTNLASIFEEPQKSDQKDEVKKDDHSKSRTDRLVTKLPLFKDVKLGEIKYKVFAQAGILPSQKMALKPNDLPEKERKEEFILAGIVPAGKFEAEAQAISTNILLLLIGIILAIFFGMPYVKLRSTQSTDRLSPSDVAILMFFSLMGTGLLTLGIFDFLTYQNLQKGFDEKLELAATAIAKNFQADLGKTREQLNHFDGSFNEKERRHENFNDNLTKQNPSSPDVHEMLWISSDGSIKALWTRDEAPWKDLRLDERTYVQRIWDKTAFGSLEDPFWLEPIYSWTTGENYAIVSQKSTVWPSNDSENGHSGRPIVAALEVKMPSVMDPVIPPGFGFAIIDHSGLVLFHADSRRNLRENLFEETDQNARLRAAVFAQTPDRFDGKYWGKDRRFFVTPLPDVRRHDAYWSLVTYWDKDLLRMTNLQALFFGGSLFSIYSTVVLGIGVLGFLVYPSLKQGCSAWMWPQHQHQRHYQLVSLLNLSSLLLVGVWSFRPAPSLDMLLWALCLPLLALAATKILLRSRPIAGDGSKGCFPLDYRQSYVFMVATILLANAMAPAFGFLKLAFDAEMRTLVKYSQYDLFLDLERREQRIQHFYREAPSNFIKNRLSLGSKGNRRDIYENFPFEVKELTVSPSSPTSSEQNSQTSHPNPVHRFFSHLFDDQPRTLHKLQTFFRVRLNSDSLDTEGFIETNGRWREIHPEKLSLQAKSENGTVVRITSLIPETIPCWPYWGLAFGWPFLVVCPALFMTMTARVASNRQIVTIGVLAACLVILGWLTCPESIVYVLTLTTGLGLFCWSLYSLPGFVARRVFFLDFPYPFSPNSPKKQSTNGSHSEDKKLGSRTHKKLKTDFMSEICPNEQLRKIGKELLKNKPLIETIRKADDYEVAKEQIIREVLEAAGPCYEDLWVSCSESQMLALFHIARDRFLHARNPEIRPLLQKGLIVLNPDLRLMNESFRRFVVATGAKQRLTEMETEGSRSTWTQVWRPMGVGVALIAVFLIFTQEQYRQITSAFLGALPGLLGTFSQLLNTAKKEKPGVVVPG